MYGSCVNVAAKIRLYGEKTGGKWGNIRNFARYFKILDPWQKICTLSPILR